MDHETTEREASRESASGHAPGDAETTVGELRDLIAKFVAEREWQPFHDPKNLAASIAIEAAELMEHFQWIRSEEIREHLANPKTLEGVRDEIADVFCYGIAFANAIGLDIASAVRDKVVKNAKKYPAERFRGRWS